LAWRRVRRDVKIEERGRKDVRYDRQGRRCEIFNTNDRQESEEEKKKKKTTLLKIVCFCFLGRKGV